MIYTNGGRYDEEAGEFIFTFMDAPLPDDPDPAMFTSTRIHEVRIPVAGITTTEAG